MKKRSIFLLTLSVFLFAFVFQPVKSVFAQYADGTYTIPYELKEAGSDNTSIADGYFQKPGKLIVENGVNYVELTITNSEWVKSLSGPYGSEQIVSEDKANDKRTVRLQVGDPSKPVTLNMHVVVPENIAGMEYDHEHTVRAVFDVSGVDSAQPTQPTPSDNGEDGMQQDVVENPQTSDDSPIALYVVMIFASIAVFVLFRFRLAKE